MAGLTIAVVFSQLSSNPLGDAAKRPRLQRARLSAAGSSRMARPGQAKQGVVGGGLMALKNVRNGFRMVNHG